MQCYANGKQRVVADDIVARLREESKRPAMRDVCTEAADTIVVLRAQLATARHTIIDQTRISIALKNQLELARKRTHSG